MAFATIRKSDMLVTAVNSTAQNPDVNSFIEVQTNADLSGIATNDYRYNQGDSTFYNVGVKAKVVTPEVPTVQLAAMLEPKIANGQKVRAKLRGLAFQTCPAGETTHMFYQLTDGNRHFDGLAYEAINRNPGDHITLKVVMPDGTDIPDVDTVFAQNWYALSGAQIHKLYRTYVANGLKIKITYVNVGANAVTFLANGFLHMDDNT